MPESGRSKGGPSRVVTFLRFAANQLQRRRNQMRALDAKESSSAQQRLVAALQAARGSSVREVRRVELRPNDLTWKGTGIHVRAGESITLFAWGAVWLSRLLAVGFEPTTALWVRVRGGPIRKMVSAPMTFHASNAGELELFVKPPCEWLDEAGQLDPGPPLKGVTGGLTAVVAVWSGDPEQGLASLPETQQPDSLAHQALSNLHAARAVPAGWNYLWRVGEGHIFRAETHEGARAVRCHTQGDVGILQSPVDVPLEPGTELEWSWCVEKLPSALPEHIRPTHDYVSIAVEFSNGLDLTYLWSAGLPVDYSFRCPLPWWCERETHMVVRSGTQELGQWVRQRRNVYEDYQKAIGGELPPRIVRVWLIAVSVFQRQPGVCSYQDVTVGTGPRRQRVL